MENRDLTLGEGNTPFIKAVRLPFYLMTRTELYFKNEIKNPTGNMADRGIYNILSAYFGKGAEGIISYADGSIALSISAYASRFGVKSYILVSKKEYKEKEYENLFDFDTEVVVIDADKYKIYELIINIGENYPLIPVIPELNSRFIEGEKRFLEEIEEKVGKIDRCIISLNNQNFRNYGIIKEMLIEKDIKLTAITQTKELANVKDIIFVEKYEVEQAYDILLKQEGIFCNIDSAVVAAGLIKLDNESLLKDNEKIVCILEENMYMKETRSANKKVTQVNYNIEDIKEVLGLK